jgi:hypothetical protein
VTELNQYSAAGKLLRRAEMLDRIEVSKQRHPQLLWPQATKE